MNMHRKKRLADLLEKMSAAFLVGTALAEEGSLVTLTMGTVCFLLSMLLTKGGQE